MVLCHGSFPFLYDARGLRGYFSSATIKSYHTIKSLSIDVFLEFAIPIMLQSH